MAAKDLFFIQESANHLLYFFVHILPEESNIKRKVKIALVGKMAGDTIYFFYGKVHNN